MTIQQQQQKKISTNLYFLTSQQDVKECFLKQKQKTNQISIKTLEKLFLNGFSSFRKLTDTS